ncbi:MAG: NAD(P)H-dependent oxidoreductase [Thermoleophilia bacterium]|nr:NAD(P)H-dependent oxidoreductase [Thermoleophilia bacterium]
MTTSPEPSGPHASAWRQADATGAEPAERGGLRVLAVSGSLRRGSTNTALLRAAAELAPPGTTVELLDGLGELPHFDADLEALDAPPPTVAALRRRVEEADALLLATPEYNGSIPGALKNAVDWLSRPRGAAALAGKPVAVVGASPGQYGAMWAQGDLRRVLGVAGARVIGDELPVARVSALLDEDGALVDEAARGRIAAQLRLLVDGATALDVAA